MFPPSNLNQFVTVVRTSIPTSLDFFVRGRSCGIPLCTSVYVMESSTNRADFQLSLIKTESASQPNGVVCRFDRQRRRGEATGAGSKTAARQIEQEAAVGVEGVRAQRQLAELIAVGKLLETNRGSGGGTWWMKSRSLRLGHTRRAERCGEATAPAA